MDQMDQSVCSPSRRESVRRSKISKKSLPRNRYPLRQYTREPASNEPKRDNLDRLLFYCGEEGCLWSHAISSNFLKHLRTNHKIEVKPQKNEVLRNAAQHILDHLNQESNTKGQQKHLHTIPLTEESLRSALVYHVVRNSLPFTTIEQPSLTSLLILCNPEVEDILITSRGTLVSDIKNRWEREKTTLRNRLQQARTKIHISLDIWTSPNTYLFLGIVAHYIPANENHQNTSLIALREIGGHSGEEQWSVLRTVLEEYGIVEKLGCIISDSASTNGTLCRTIHNYFSEELFMMWDYKTNQIRCIGHIINLIVQAFLFGQLKEEELEVYDREETERSEIMVEVEQQRVRQQQCARQQQRVRQQMSSLGKLHNIVVHIRSSASRTKQFVKEAGGRIPLDNRTRWNSWHAMLEQALNFEKSIDYYLKTQPDLNLDILKPKDWDMLRTMHTFLVRFKDHTKQLESDGNDISQVLPHLLHVKLWLTANKQKISRKDGQPATRTTAEDRDFLQRVQNAEAAWQKWWDLIWGNTTYLLATMLNPIYRTKWFKEGLKAIGVNSETVQEGLDRANMAWNLWHEQKKEEDRIERLNKGKTEPKKRRTTYHLRTKPAATIYELNERVFGDWESNDVSELEEYLSQPVTQLPKDKVRDFKPLAWWCKEDQQDKWSHLSSLAIFVLSLPAMSAEPERVFSGARRTISWERSQLRPDIIEILECLKHIFRSRERAP
jgi:hAT family C-terminal dimerisation region